MDEEVKETWQQRNARLAAEREKREEQLARLPWKPSPEVPSYDEPTDTAIDMAKRAEYSRCYREYSEQRDGKIRGAQDAMYRTLFDAVRGAFARGTISKEELANRMGCKTGYITRAMNQNHFEKDYWIPRLLAALELEIRIVLPKQD